MPGSSRSPQGARNIELVVMVLTGREDQATVATHGQAYAGFMGELAARYPEVRFWQVLNEPDAGNWGVWFLGDTVQACAGNRVQMGQRYADLLKLTYPKIKAANPAAWVLMAGLTGTEGFVTEPTGRRPAPFCGGKVVAEALSWNFLRAFYAAGGKPYFDIMAVHAYGHTPWSPGSFQQKGHALAQVLAEPGISDANRPIWITGFGAGADHTSDQGRLLDPTQRSQWRTAFDNDQKTWWENAIAIQSAERVYHKLIGFQLIEPSSGAVYGPTADRDFLDADTLDYGLGIYRYDPATGLATTPRPTFTMLTGRAVTNRAAASIDAQGGRIGPFSVPVFGRVPLQHRFRYQTPNRVVVEDVLVKTLVPTVVPTFVPLRYAAHVADIGWMADVYNDQAAGTVGQSRRMEALRISKVELSSDVSVCYQAHVSGTGWLPEVCNGAVAGTVGQSRQMEAMRVRVVDPQQRWRVCYQAYGPAYGWGPEVCDNDVAGTIGQSQRMEAVRVRLYRR